MYRKITVNRNVGLNREIDVYRHVTVNRNM